MLGLVVAVENMRQVFRVDASACILNNKDKRLAHDVYLVGNTLVSACKFDSVGQQVVEDNVEVTDIRFDAVVKIDPAFIH